MLSYLSLVYMYAQRDLYRESIELYWIPHRGRGMGLDAASNVKHLQVHPWLCSVNVVVVGISISIHYIYIYNTYVYYCIILGHIITHTVCSCISSCVYKGLRLYNYNTYCLLCMYLLQSGYMHTLHQVRWFHEWYIHTNDIIIMMYYCSCSCRLS